MHTFLESRASRVLLCIVGVGSLCIFSFSLGNAVGFHRASFALHWGEKYQQNFGGQPNRLPSMRGSEAPMAHGVSGRVDAISLPQLVISGNDGWEKTIIINDLTNIRRLRDTVTPDTLQIGDQAVIVGRPDNDGRIEATLIRVFPTP